MRIVLASDHAGFAYKEIIKKHLSGHNFDVEDYGTSSDEPIDYPIVIRPAAEAVAEGTFDRGIILGGSGNGEAIVANRIPGIRCAVCWNVESARLSREHNDANIMSLGERLIPVESLLDIVDIWLTTPFNGGRHERRIRLIDSK
jgi:ribose 5-phosphate isomerase B